MGRQPVGLDELVERRTMLEGELELVAGLRQLCDPHGDDETDNDEDG
ncbi:hypothetical protein ACSNOI_07420 [Actinomadura kijaniata]